MDETTTRAPGELMRAFLARIEASDFEAVAALLHEDAVFDLPFRVSDPITTGRDVIVESLRAGLGAFVKNIRFEVHVTYPSQDGQSAVTEYSSEGERVAGGMYRNRYISILKARAGRIVLLREYYNPLKLAPDA